MSNPLLTTKLYIPRRRTTQRLVPRPQLVARLNEALNDRLTLISAPAGFGKTTLLSEWIPHSHRCVAWVSLDAGDNDPIRFWTYGIAALQMLQPGLGQSALPLSRLRARRQLTEIRAADLRFIPNEAAAFLNEVMGLSLSAEDIAALETRTEGWIAGLQLAALSMQGRSDVAGFIRAFTGSHIFIVDYLVEEVLQRQPAQVQTFLAQTSILERLSGLLCDAVTERADSQAILEKLQHDNLFIIPLDDERRWYRYHHLFAEVLRARLGPAHSEEVRVLHRRASKWYEHNGLIAEAVQHALTAGAFEQTARLIEEMGLTVLALGSRQYSLDKRSFGPARSPKFSPGRR